MSDCPPVPLATIVNSLVFGSQAPEEKLQLLPLSTAHIRPLISIDPDR